jgi:hypothetical protein
LANATTDAGCGLSDGSAIVTASGGSFPYTYMWDANASSQTTQTATGLMAGAYVVTFTDVNGCAGIDTITIANPNAPTASASASTMITCFNTLDGQVTAAGAGGTGPYTYLWSDGQSTAVATGLGAGVYNVTVTDGASCTGISSVTLTAPSEMTIAPTTVLTNVSCNGGTDGAIALVITGGTPGYNYAWSNGATTASLTGLSAGTYMGSVTDANGCSVAGPVPITEPAVLAAAAADNGNGSATASATGGTAPYTYMWSDGQTTATATGLMSNTYGVTVTDANGCTTPTTVVVVVVAIGDIANLNSLSMSPNPTSANVFVELDLAKSSKVVIRVTNTIGQTVLENKLGVTQSGRIELNTKDLSTGVYMVQFVIDGQTITEKLVIDRK